MEHLISALQIFLKYQNNDYPTICQHDELIIAGITKSEVSLEDRKKLETLGFRWSEDIGERSDDEPKESDMDGYWSSTRYGSA